MKNARKLVLVPIELWVKVKKDIPKTEHYSNMEVEVEQAPQMKVMKVMKSGKNVTMKQTQKMKKKKEKRNQTTWIIDALPKKYKPKAYSLLRYIKWTSDGTFKNENKIIPKSNILLLVLHTLLKNVKEKPPGLNEHYKGLTEVNVPEYLIANNLGKQIIMGYGEDVDWGPLGELENKRKRNKPKWNK